MSSTGRAGRAEEGSVALEAAIIAPALLLFVLLAIAAGRLQTAGGTVDAAARAAARSASLARTAEAARQAADTAAGETLEQQGVHCSSTRVEVDTSLFGTVPGQAGEVTAVVRCTVPLDDLLVGGLPGSRTMTGRFTSVVDRYRGR
ncbi:TadE/TadG family type IV pilus assembly protein [Streptacidiphilus griseoplanus]|uniref:TadE/TadG family type IV pilus assembly protein n=1 Tax=Peterkaempfera griseoplana TaxID=66896 RepID=UPI0006E3A187|nr:TadE/TadG family type IV pilus assembly protein [Peterkaempfera griseoplana]